MRGYSISYIERLGMLSFFPWLDQAVQQNGQSLQHASDELQLDPELQEVVGSLKIRCPGKLLASGFKYLLVSLLFGEDSHTDIFQMAWNHQPEEYTAENWIWFT